MALLTLVGQNVEIPVIEGFIDLPRYGVWVADLAIDAQAIAGVTGQVTIQAKDGSVAFNGTAIQTRTNVEFQSVLMRVIGGAYGMATTLQPKAYQQVNLQTVLTDILTAAGETLSPTSDPGVLATFFPFWVRNLGVASSAVTSLLEDTGASWRVLNDGSVFVGPETWPQFNTSIPYDFLGTRPQEASQTISMSSPMLIPGVTFNKVKVSSVLHEILQRQIRTRFWFEVNQ